MKISFLSLNGSFDYSQIGGTDSLMRRLINGLLNFDKKVEILSFFYNSNNQGTINHNSRLISKYYLIFEEALSNLIETSPEHVICTYISPKDRIKFVKFRKNNAQIKFHNILYFHPESKIKRLIKFSEFYLAPYNGNLYCISSRQYEYIRKIVKNSFHLFPPVPDDWFLEPFNKPINNKVKISFIGRIDPRKGVNEVINIFSDLRKNSAFECEIYGIHIPWDKEGFDIHKRLLNQDDIKYIPFDRNDYSQNVETIIKKVLKNTDITILPYRSLDSTLDIPLLLLESMASLCTIITTPVGDIPKILGKSEFIIPNNNFESEAKKLIYNISSEKIQKEKKRIFDRIQELNFNTKKVVEEFYISLTK